jgi:hypothetical protein
MLTISLEKLAYIITKAREFDVGVSPVDEDSGSNPSDDAEWDVLEAGADNPTRQELVDAINGLNDPERIELLAFTWLGRGDYTKEEWREALEEARRIHDEKETRYLIGTPTTSRKHGRSSVIPSTISKSAACSENASGRCGVRQ